MDAKSHFINTFVANCASRLICDNSLYYYGGFKSKNLTKQIPVEDLQKMAEKLWLRMENK